MNHKPTAYKRNVLLALQAQDLINSILPELVETRILGISALFCDHEEITEGIYQQCDEADLLRSFWRDIRSSDRIFATNVDAMLATIRRRTWKLCLIPSIDLALSGVYMPELHEMNQQEKN